MRSRLTRRPATLPFLTLLAALALPPAAAPSDSPRSEASAAKGHWAFQPVRRPEPPSSRFDPRARNLIDRFVFARLEENSLEPSPEADRRTLIRRLSLDLIGLPPSPEEVEAFVADTRPDAFERLVDRLLASPHFGERWARHWLDVVRYAETHGFEMNNPRPNAWPYRDYVIRAFNEDIPYDRFVIEQLAGDTVGADAATGFLVAGPWDQVKSPDEVLTRNQRADELHDIINATSTAFLGLTVACARCHDHKFDPIPQQDYFAIKAVFDGVQHGDREVEPPRSEERAARLAAALEELAAVDARLAALEPLARVAPDDSGGPLRAPVQRGANIDRFAPVRARFLRFTITATSDAEPCIDELEVFTTDQRNVALARHGTRATASGTYPNSEIHRLEHVNDGIYGNERSWISNERGRGWVMLEFSEPAEIDRVVWSRDRSPEPVYSDRLATGYRIEVSTDGESWLEVANHRDRLPRGGDPAAPRLAGAPETADSAERRELFARKTRLERRIRELRDAPRIYAGTFQQPEPTHRWHRGDPMHPREVIEPGVLSFEPLRMGAPRIPADAPESDRRRALAEWIASPDNPLTARVIVNRLWQHHFGEGLVSTPSDFGLNGARPSHPELLDWLASELVRPSAAPARPWSLKHIHRLIVTSATYRQSSAADAGSDSPRAPQIERARAADAGNRLLWRYPSRRLEAEPLRDAMLLVAGQLDLTMGGPGWSPFKPNDNYVRVYEPKDSFEPADFRRMVYATVVRQRPEGVFGAFDCPDGGQTAPVRTRSITPLQALNLLNSGFIMQVSEQFAERLRRDAGDDPADHARRAFALAFQRKPTAEELAAATRFIMEEGLPLFCRAILNANEFAFVF